jgi:outer membrane immunogenic protein
MNKKTFQKTTLILILLLFKVTSYSQNKLDIGEAQINVGLGISNWGVPVYVGADFGAIEDFTLGAEFSYRNFNERFDINKYRHRISCLLINGNYHFNNLFDLPNKFDLYAGLNIGFYSWRYDQNYISQPYSGRGWGGQAGGRYFLSEKVGINLEFGGGVALSGGKLGLTFKL